ncbi:MAG: Gfo/Idh/MocA family oxidoreductase [Aliarcobacter skirrowii]|uniref:Gfo/Idh/MocA family oxidoreductase n=1 Tax=Aliarcobacter skirrowii TaxID=28200 RepID=UPI00242FD2B9|nr:Gfo/Idh/MocA family oxidoreductase [Aliarcobacter skirrowii]MDD2509021.1 Gfo/Idh/MocA family oxidoreductase [Aliarcobacter skirrowii]MDD3497018.1 Gfo/Idh/MocA family oxidoreductase [Aliarcobacter skirrowii]
MNKIWLIGAGGMAQDYIKVLKDLEKKFVVIGRGEDTAKKCEETTGCKVQIGGLEEFITTKPEICSHAIVAVGVEKLYETTKLLLEYGVKNILVEKPGALETWQFEELNNLSKEKNAYVIIAYNRRFYASTLKAQEIIKQDGGVTSFNFEFTEWAHVIEPLVKAEGVKEKWFLGNSTHVVDLAFYLGGKPKEINSFTSGSLSWHPSASNFSGSGISEKNALFNYQANWESAGRWSLEILTKEHRLIFRPMEKLQIQKRGTIAQIFDENIDYSLDEKYKPGLYIQAKNFLESKLENMCTIEEQFKMIDIYNKIANYKGV